MQQIIQCSNTSCLIQDFFFKRVYEISKYSTFHSLIIFLYIITKGSDYEKDRKKNFNYFMKIVMSDYLITIE